MARVFNKVYDRISFLQVSYCALVVDETISLGIKIYRLAIAGGHVQI